MSVTALSWAWKQSVDPTSKLVLLALSDHANDEDFTCWPSLNHLQRKTGFNRTTVWRTIDRLIEMGGIARAGIHGSGATIYRVLVGAQCTLGAESNQVQKATQVGAQDNKVGAHSNKVGAQDTPNHKNHKNHKEPSGRALVAQLPIALDVNVWNRWTEYRKNIKKPIKPASEQAAMRKLAAYGAQQAAVVDQSIANGWQGLFDLKSEAKTGSGGRKTYADYAGVEDPPAVRVIEGALCVD